MVDDSGEIRPTETKAAGAGPGAVEPAGVLGGFSQSVSLLEFGQIRQQLAAYTRTAMGREAALSLTPSPDLLEVASRQQETTEARQFLDQGGSLEFGPGIDFREYVQRALLGGLLRGEELYAIRGLAAAARYGVVPVGRVASVDKGPNAGRKAVYLRDPDGITIEFIGG